MKESIKSCCMVCLLLVILFLVLAILYPFLNKKKEHFNDRKFNRCCGNMDWYLGDQLYNQECKKNKSKAMESFKNKAEEEETHHHKEQVAKPIKFKKNFIEQDDEDLEKFCQSHGLKAAYSPMICTEGEGLNISYDYNRNCKCVDEKNNCKMCYPKPNWASLT